MRNQSAKEVINEIKGIREVLKTPEKDIKPAFKGEIDKLLEEVPLSKVNRAKALWDNWCKEIMENEELEQIYRAFGSSYKTRRSYFRFKNSAVLLLYIYGYISDEELDLIEKDIDTNGKQVFEKHREELEAIKEIDDALKDQPFGGHIPMNVSCLAIGAGIAFSRAVKAILDVIERLHKDKDYREGHYYGGVIDWDEGFLLRNYPYTWLKKGGKEALWQQKEKKSPSE